MLARTVFGVAVGVAVAVGVGLGVGVGVGGTGCTSNDPMSLTPNLGRPRWSWDGAKASLPELMAGLLLSSANVAVFPPLSFNESRRGSVFRLSPVAFSRPSGPVVLSPP